MTIDWHALPWRRDLVWYGLVWLHTLARLQWIYPLFAQIVYCFLLLFCCDCRSLTSLASSVQLVGQTNNHSFLLCVCVYVCVLCTSIPICLSLWL